MNIRHIIMIIYTIAVFTPDSRVMGGAGNLDKEQGFMKEMDDLRIKKEIDEIAKRIEAIVQNIDQLDPNRQESESIDE